MTSEYIGTKQVTAWPSEKDDRPGYAVRYADGSSSWSPKDVFEAAYIEIGHITHLPAHQQRVIGERAQLSDKIGKLTKFIVSGAFKELDVNDRYSLITQIHAMRAYDVALIYRINDFDLAERIEYPEYPEVSG